MKELLRKIRHNHLLILFNIGFIITLGALLLEIDRQYYQSEKRQYIKENWYALFPIKKEDLTEKSRLIFDTHIRELKNTYISELEKSAQEIVDGPLSIYRVQLVDVYDEEIVDTKFYESGRPFLNPRYTFNTKIFSFGLRHISNTDKNTIMSFYNLNKTSVVLWTNEQDSTVYAVNFLQKPDCQLDTSNSEWKMKIDFKQVG